MLLNDTLCFLVVRYENREAGGGGGGGRKVDYKENGATRIEGGCVVVAALRKF